jgi:2-methylcitrate dehydratase
MIMDRILQSVSDYGTALTYEKLSPGVVHQVRRLVIDSLGCAMGGYQEEPPQIARAHALEVTAAQGATVLGTSHRTSAELAAFANGVMMRYLDFNDAMGGSGHPSGNIAAVLAAAEHASADARTAITGIVLAYEVQICISEAAKKRLAEARPRIRTGWDHATYMALGSAAGAARALGLDQTQMANALALATTTSAALMQTRQGSLSMWKGCAEGNSSRNGVFYALLARRGMTGPAEAFEGVAGFMKQVSGPFELPPLGGNGQPFQIEASRFKYFPTDYEAQIAVHPAVELHKLLGGKVDQIEKVVVDAYGGAIFMAADSREKWNPTNRETADHSLPYVLAVALARGTVWLDDFTEERIRDPKVHALMQKIEVRENEEYTRAFPESNCFRIEVLTKSGEKHAREIRHGKGHPKNPMTDQEIETKFRKLTEPLLGPAQATKALDRLWHLEEMRDLREIWNLFKL